MQRLAVFDFDQTLFQSPENTEENKERYEKQTGIPWIITKEMSIKLSEELGQKIKPRSGWWGKVETLMPPLVPDLIPEEMWIKETVADLLRTKACPVTKTIIMTGRHLGMKQQILRILYQSGFCNVLRNGNKNEYYKYYWNDPVISLYLSGMSGPYPDNLTTPPSETFQWKVWIIRQYCALHPDLEKIEIWEDRDEHVKRFINLKEETQKEIIVHHVNA